MTPQQKLLRLKPVADLIKDRDLAAFAAINRQREALLAGLSALGDLPPADNGGLISDAIFAKAAEDHSLWRSQRRAALNAELARCSASWTEKRDMAERAFGRSAMLDGEIKKKGG